MGEINTEVRSAIKSHKTATSDKSWDGPAAKANLKNDGSAEYYISAFAWKDPDGDPETKAAYKFIHHEVSSDGDVGAANIRACQTGIGVLNGARGGTTIPDDDKKGVWNHLASHLKDADVEPPELKSRADSTKPEKRSFDVQELRIVSENGDKKIRGYAAVFNRIADIGWYNEIIEPGAFADTIKEDDIRALWNHNPDYVLGRTKNGTLTLREDEKGLYIEITPPDTTFANDLMTSIERGDVDQMSFGFNVIDERSETKDGKDLRTLVKIKLFDVSPVTYPAYIDTEVYIRSMADKTNIDVGILAKTISNDLSPEQLTKFRKTINELSNTPGDTHDSPEPMPGDSDDISNEGQKTNDNDGNGLFITSLNVRKKRLQLIENEMENIIP